MRAAEREGGESVEVIIRGTPEEIAALVVATQERQVRAIKVNCSTEKLTKDLREAIRGTF